MRLWELFDAQPIQIMDDLKSKIIDVLTPFIVAKAPFITVQQVMDQLKNIGTDGISPDRGLVMDLLDPDKTDSVEKIEGDKIYLNNGETPERMVNKDQKEKDEDKISKDALKQAKKEVSK